MFNSARSASFRRGMAGSRSLGRSGEAGLSLLYRLFLRLSGCFSVLEVGPIAGKINLLRDRPDVPSLDFKRLTPSTDRSTIGCEAALFLGVRVVLEPIALLKR